MTARIRPFLHLASLAALLGACGEAPMGRGEVSAGSAVTKGDDLEDSASSTTSGDDFPATAHHEAVVSCEAKADHARAHLNEARTDVLVDLERERNDCLVVANDAARAPVEAMLTEAADSWADQVGGIWDAQRSTAIAACNALVETTPQAADERRPAASATCVSMSELHFATVLDAYVDFGDVPFSIAGARDRYSSCYAAYDDAQANAAGVDPLAEGVLAEEGLADCVSGVHEELAPELASRVVALFPDRDPLQVETDLRDAFATQLDARSKVCIIAAHAGVQRTSPDVDLERAECLVDAAIQAGDVLALVAPDLLQDGETDGGGTDDGDSSSGGTDDGGSESSTTF
jgi:hypothetical protein